MNRISFDGGMMRRLFVALFAVYLIAIFASTASAQGKAQGWCENGGTSVTIPGTQGSGIQKFQQSFPSCTVTVYAAGTLNLATIYSDNAGTAKANPFTASSNGQWFFYAANGIYDVKFSGGGILASFTLGAVQVGLQSLTCSEAAGATFGAQATQAASLLPSTGGIIDCSGLHGAQTISGSDPFSGITKPITLIWPTGTVSSSVSLTIPSTMTVDFPEGGILSMANATTATVNGEVRGTMSQHFAGSGSVVISSPFTKEVYPQWWGVLGNNTGDDSAAFNKAAQAVKAFGGRVFIPPGDYRFNTQSVADGNGYSIFAWSNVEWVGSGINSTRLYTSIANTSTFYSRLATHFAIRDLTIITSEANAGTNNDCIKLLSDQYFEVQNVECRGSRIGFQFLGSTDGVVSGNWALNQINDGLGDDARGFSVGNDGTTGAARLKLYGNHSLSSQTHGFIVFSNSSTSGLAVDIQLSDNTALTCPLGSGFRIDVGVKAVLTNNIADGCDRGFHVLTAAGSLFSNNLAINSLLHGFWLEGAQTNTFTGNKALDNGTSAANTYDGFFLQDDAGTNGSALNTFAGNISRNSGGTGQRYGFNDSGANSGQNTIDGGEFQNNQTAAFSLKATDSYCSRVNCILSGTINYTNWITPTISGTVNDYNPTGFSTAGVVAVTLGGTARTITGFAAPTSTGAISGRTFILCNIDTAADLTVSDQSGSSSAGNRVFAANNTDAVIRRSGCAPVIYDSASGANAWRVIAP